MVGYARSCRTFCDQHDEILNGIIVTAVARTLIGGVFINIFMFCPTSFFWNQIQIYQFETKLVGQNMNILINTPHINALATDLIIVTNFKLQLYLLGDISQITMFVLKTIFPYKQRSMKKML